MIISEATQFLKYRAFYFNGRKVIIQTKYLLREYAILDVATVFGSEYISMCGMCARGFNFIKQDASGTQHCTVHALSVNSVTC